MGEVLAVPREARGRHHLPAFVATRGPAGARENIDGFAGAVGRPTAQASFLSRTFVADILRRASQNRNVAGWYTSADVRALTRENLRRPYERVGERAYFLSRASFDLY